MMFLLNWPVVVLGTQDEVNFFATEVFAIEVWKQVS